MSKQQYIPKNGLVLLLLLLLPAAAHGQSNVMVGFDPEPPMEGQSVQVTATSFVETPSAGRIFYRRTGEQRAFATTPFTISGNQLTATIPAEFVTRRGIEGYVEYTDSKGTFTFPEVNPAQNPLYVPVFLLEGTTEAALRQGIYRMISVPLLLREPDPLGTLSETYGAYAEDNWRLLRWRDDRYIEGPQLNTLLVPGNAFWLVTRALERFTVQSGLSVLKPFDSSYEVTIGPGWNQIAVPYAFPVAWEQVERSGDVEAPQLYDDDRYVQQQVLCPWEGYFVFNREPVDVNLTFLPKEAPGAPCPLQANIRPTAAYLVQLVAEAPSARLRDAQNFIGFADEAAPGRDALDFAEPPEVAEHVRLSLLEAGHRLAGSFRPPGDGQAWEVEVTASEAAGWSSARPVTVTLVEQGARPPGFDLYVLDPQNNTLLPTPGGQFTVALSAALPVRRLKVLVGPPSLVAAYQAEETLPAASGLQPAFPNPFTVQTTLTYQLHLPERVAVEVYDLLGRRVRTLVAGTQQAGAHEARWDGRSDAGLPLPGGVYWVRLQAGASSTYQKVILFR